MPLRYFDEVLAVEIAAINRRRQRYRLQGAAGEDVRPLNPAGPQWHQPLVGPIGVDPTAIDRERTRPQPIPCTAVGVALSGGGIRSAAVCLGALQALNTYRVIARTDYLSTVSGGGYIGACMTARMSQGILDPAQPNAAPRPGLFPFGDADIRDNDVVGYIRNYSNYLLPRARSGIVNFFDIAAILLRGLFANSVVVLNVLVGAALLTYANYLVWADLTNGNYILRTGWIGLPGIFGIQQAWPEPLKTAFVSTTYMACIYAGILILWALIRSLSTRAGNDANSPALFSARLLLGLLTVSIFLDLQPLCIHGLSFVLNYHLALISWPAVVGAVAIAVFARRLGAFLETTQIPSAQAPSKNRLLALRIATQIILIAAGMVLPLVLLVIYWFLTAWLFPDNQLPEPFNLHFSVRTYLWFFLATLLCAFLFTGNAYSLHQFYKDRLTRAFLFRPRNPANPNADQTAWVDFKLSQIETDHCPYHIINAALNVQGSAEANRRGRNADFFTFTKHFVGSDLTHFAATKSTAPGRPPAFRDMEAIDPLLDVGSTIAISGAALSANMGSNTVRWLSPTLALLNIRLGYWLRNPRALIAPNYFGLKTFLLNRVDEFFLLLEMLNVLDEKRSYVYLSDGGHIENLGIYQLLKRGCRLIIAIDAEADPAISCASLLKLERYARIDLGIRVVLPWEQIARRHAEIDRDIDPRSPGRAQRHRGQHCALGPIIYPDGSRGILLYFKSSLSGDEKDYLLDYKKRYPDFPHETTGDQFFTEEQFEVYRSLGYHIVDGYFSGTDEISYQSEGPARWPSEARAREEVAVALGLAQQIPGAAQ